MNGLVARVLRLAAARLGLKQREEWAEAGEEALAEASRLHGFTAAEIVSRLETSDALLFEIASHLTIGETHFYRHPYHFDAFAEYVRGQVLGGERDGGAERRLFVWSAGCATGEEPYSLAIAVNEKIGSWSLPRVEIVGTDASIQSVGKGRHAAYTSWSFRGVPMWLKARYFHSQVQDTHLRLREEIRDAVHIEPGNILARVRSMRASSVDVLFFRNVAIYLERAPLRRFYVDCARVLRPGGLLFTSPSDPRPRGVSLESTGDHTGSIFKKPHVARGARPSARATGAPPPGGARVEPQKERPRPVPPVAERPARPARAPSPQHALLGQVSRLMSHDHDAAGGGPEELRARVRTMADRGELRGALELASVLVTESGDTTARVLRAQLLLNAARPEEAIADLRAALFLDPKSTEGRFWYAVALQQAGERVRCERQLDLVERALAEADDGGAERLDGDRLREIIRAIRGETTWA